MNKRKYVSYDICFCDSKCKWKARCERHIGNVPDGVIVAVSSLEGTDLCKKVNFEQFAESKREYNRIKQRESRERRKQRKDD